MLLSIKELIELYDYVAMSDYGLKYFSHDSAEVFRFIRNWRESDVIKVPCGYLRVTKTTNPYVRELHGIFLSNPYRYRKILENMVYLYLQGDECLSHLEIHVPEEQKGLIRFLDTCNLDKSVLPNEVCYFIWRK